MGKIDRKYLAHFIDATPSAEPGGETYVRLGQDLEEYSPEMSADVETTKNILGQSSIKISAYSKTGSVEPFYADKDDPLFTFLQKIIDDDLTLDDVKTTVVEVKLWGEAAPESEYEAIQEEVYIEVSSYGGDTTGYQIPFNIHYSGKKVKGKFNISTNKFTADGAA